MAHMTSQQAQAIITGLFREHNLFGWTVRFGYAKRTAGQCDQRRKVIILSKYLMAQRSYADTENTITHEIAHAIVGAGHGHDYTWALKHRELGGDGKRCFQHYDEKSPWVGVCQRCDQEYARYRQPQRLEGWRCRCDGRSPVVWLRRKAA